MTGTEHHVQQVLERSTDVLIIAQLSYHYTGHQQPTLQDVSVSVRKGEIVSILGPSGCGKSTLLNLIAGVIGGQKGAVEIRHDGLDCSQPRVGYIFQDDALLPWRTVRDNFALATEVGRIPKSIVERDTKEFLASFHLEPSILPMYPAQLSGGMRQRASIIQALLFNPQLVLLDEPFSALDFFTKLRLEGEFYNLVKKKQKTAVMVTHDIEEAIAVSDRIFILNRRGQLACENKVTFAGLERNPETLRGEPQFAALYREILAQFKAVTGS
jgi:NitT/TauT family transport system ATP-binding protein